MALSSDLLSQIAKTIATPTKETTPSVTTVTGTAKEYAGKIYVQIDGSDQLTPVASSTAGMKDGDRVTVQIKNHSVTVTGNVSDPSATQGTVDGVKQDVADQIAQVEILVADKVSTVELEAEKARIDDLIAENVTIKGDLTAVNADIDKLQADVADLGDLSAVNAEIENLKATKADITLLEAEYATIENLEATNADIHNLEVDYGSFKVLATDKLTAVDADIDNLEATKLSAEQADIKYAQIDFANIGEAAVEELFTKAGIIGDLVMDEGHVTGTLVGVTIIGDLIEGGTVKADKLVIQGEDGLYYKLNVSGESVAAEQTEYNSLNGSIITANTITAEKINVSDLVAFDATIGGFKITEDSLYSGVKASVDNTTRGTYMDDQGQFAIGDQNNYLKFFYDETDSKWKLVLSANSIKLGASSSSLEDELNEIKDSVQQAQDSTKLADIRSGTVVQIGENAGKKPIGVTVYGETRQNLWVNPSGIANGVTATANFDGSLTMSGTPTSSNSNLGTGRLYILKPNTQYTVSVDKQLADTYTLTAGATFYVHTVDTDGEYLSDISFGTPGRLSVTFTTGATLGRMQCEVIVRSGTTVSGTYRIMLNEGSTAQPWCPPGLNSVGQLRDNEKNLWRNPADETKAGITLTNNPDGGFSVEGTFSATGTNWANFSIANQTTLKPNTRYNLSSDRVFGNGTDHKGGAFYIQEFSSSGTLLATTYFGYSPNRLTYGLTTNSELNRCVFGLQAMGGQTYSGEYHVMVNEGEVAQSFRPPEAETALNVVTTGKNLLPSGAFTSTANGTVEYKYENGVITVSSGTTGDSFRVLQFRMTDIVISNNGVWPIPKSIVPGKQYAFVTEGYTYRSTNRFRFMFYDDNGPLIDMVYPGTTNPFTFTVPEGTLYWQVALTFSANTTLPAYTCTAALYEADREIDEVVPVVPDRLGVVDLQGHVLASLPDGTRDELHIDENGNAVLTKRVGEAIAPTEASGYIWATDVTGGRASFALGHTPVTPPGTQVGHIMCDKLPPRVTIDDPSYIIVAANSRSYVRNPAITDTAAAATLAGGATLLYQLATPQTIPLGTVTLPALPKDAATVWADSSVPAEMDVEYWTTLGEKVADAQEAASDAIKSTTLEFYRSTSPTSLAGGSWSTTAPTWTEGTYIWQRTLVAYNNGATAYTPSVNGVCITGNDGANGADGIGVKSTAIAYNVSTSGTTIPTDTWGTSIPTVPAGQYLWTRTTITYTDGKSSVMYAVSRSGTNGSAGKGIKSTAVTYQAGSSQTSYPTGSWSTSVPKLTTSLPYLWTRTIITYTDNTTSTSYSVSSTLESFEVGGRNLAIGTKTLDAEGDTPSTGATDSDVTWNGCISEPTLKAWDGPYIRLVDIAIRNKLKVGDILTVSQKFMTNFSPTKDVSFIFYRCDGNGGTTNGGAPKVIARSEIEPNTWYTISFTISVTEYLIDETLDDASVGGNRARIETNYYTTSDYYFNADHTAVMYMAAPKVELGTKPTDWTPAPEDVQQGIDDAQDAADSAHGIADNALSQAQANAASIEVLNNSIAQLVTDANGSSLMTQTSDGWTFNIGSLQSDVEDNATAINEVLGDMSDINSLANRTKDLVDDIAEKTAYFTLTQDDNGDPCMELGRTDSDFKLRITNTSIDFMQGTSKIAYISNRQLYITSSVVTDEMKVGATSGFVWKKRANGNMGLRWEAS